MTSGATAAQYGWLGAAQRSADTPTGTILMGVRLYAAALGRFLQVDPVVGGSANAYDYCNADPVNCTDLDGRLPAWAKKGLSALSKVASAAGRAATAAGKWAWKNRDTIALGLAVVGMFACTVCTVAFYAGMAVSAASTAYSCAKGARVDCTIGIAGGVLGGAGRGLVAAGRPLIKRGTDIVTRHGTGGLRGAVGDLIKSTGRSMYALGQTYGAGSTALAAVSAFRTAFNR